jgi:hypothetical protein
VSTFSFGTVHAFVDTLVFELEQMRAHAAQERLLHGLGAERVPSVRTHRPSWHRHGRPGTPHLTGAR